MATSQTSETDTTDAPCSWLWQRSILLGGAAAAAARVIVWAKQAGLHFTRKTCRHDAKMHPTTVYERRRDTRPTPAQVRRHARPRSLQRWLNKFLQRAGRFPTRVRRRNCKQKLCQPGWLPASGQAGLIMPAASKVGIALHRLRSRDTGGHRRLIATCGDIRVGMKCQWHKTK